MPYRCEACNRFVAFYEEHECDFELEGHISYLIASGLIPDFRKQKEVLEQIVDGQTPDYLYYSGSSQHHEVTIRALADAVYKLIVAYEKDSVGSGFPIPAKICNNNR